MKVIISGGGTGGHIFPALSIAGELKKRIPQIELLFVGAKGRMEMTRVPEAGYDIIGLPIAGINRKKLWKNIGLPFKLLKSRRLAARIVKDFQPDIVIGVGGYASAPILNAANNAKIPTLLQEQNSYAGLTNKMFAQRATRVCVAYEGMERFFPKEIIVLTGNPVRQGLLTNLPTREEALQRFSLSPMHKTILLLGGSLGARTLNEAMRDGINRLIEQGIQVIWQTGTSWHQEHGTVEKELSDVSDKVVITEFITDMAAAYMAADLVISRAGAGSISELCLVGKPAIFVPSPNVTEDHQTKNARALVDKEAALMVADAQAGDELITTTLQAMQDENLLARLARNATLLAKPNAAEQIVDEICLILNP